MPWATSSMRWPWDMQPQQCMMWRRCTSKCLTGRLLLMIDLMFQLHGASCGCLDAQLVLAVQEC